jgi:hypothetical protein
MNAHQTCFAFLAFHWSESRLGGTELPARQQEFGRSNGFTARLRERLVGRFDATFSASPDNRRPAFKGRDRQIVPKWVPKERNQSFFF